MVVVSDMILVSKTTTGIGLRVASVTRLRIEALLRDMSAGGSIRQGLIIERT